MPLDADWRLRTLRGATALCMSASSSETTSPASEAFADLASDVTALRSYEALLRQLLRDGVPTARVYSALLIGRLNPIEGRRALARLTGSTSPLEVHVGSSSSLSTVGEVARLLSTRLGPVSLRSIRS